jgi:hypothetical protein
VCNFISKALHRETQSEHGDTQRDVLCGLSAKQNVGQV